MGARRQGHRVRKYATSQGAPPSEYQTVGSAGLDHRRNSASSIRASGQALRMIKVPSNATHRLHRAGHTLPPAADSDFDFPFFSCRTWGSAHKFHQGGMP